MSKFKTTTFHFIYVGGSYSIALKPTGIWLEDKTHGNFKIMGSFWARAYMAVNRIKIEQSYLQYLADTVLLHFVCGVIAMGSVTLISLIFKGFI